MSGLTEQDMRILAFERRGWRSPGVKELIDHPEALAFDPVLVKRLRAQRARRQRMRSPRPKAAKGRPG